MHKFLGKLPNALILWERPYPYSLPLHSYHKQHSQKNAIVYAVTSWLKKGTRAALQGIKTLRSALAIN